MQVGTSDGFIDAFDIVMFCEKEQRHLWLQYDAFHTHPSIERVERYMENIESHFNKNSTYSPSMWNAVVQSTFLMAHKETHMYFFSI